MKLKDPTNPKPTEVKQRDNRYTALSLVFYALLVVGLVSFPMQYFSATQSNQKDENKAPISKPSEETIYSDQVMRKPEIIDISERHGVYPVLHARVPIVEKPTHDIKIDFSEENDYGKGWTTCSKK